MKEYMLKVLEREYRNAPTSQPTAFWKMREWLREEETQIIKTEKACSLVRAHMLLLRYPISEGYDPRVDKGLHLLVFKDPQDIVSDYREERYFKLSHNHKHIDKSTLEEPYCFKTVRPEEYDAVVSFINNSYTEIKVNINDVVSWSKRKVYDETLWVWIIHKRTNEKLALGIAELDPVLDEGALEWIQVKQSYQGRGLGKSIVNELLDRISKRADFTTVSGDVDNETSPEKMYRRCGFEGDIIWHVYKKNKCT